MRIKLLLILLLAITAFTAYSQDYNPYKSIGKKGKIVTAYGNRFVEVFDYDSIQRIGSVLFNIRTKKIVKLLNADAIFKKNSDNSAASRWYSVDPLATKGKNISVSPYVFVADNPISLVDPDGRDWFYYREKGEKNKSWHFQEGNKATYTNTRGKTVSTKNGYDYLVTFKVTGKNDDGSTVGTLTVYNQSHADVQVKGFSGSDVYNLSPIGKGNYMMNLSRRDADGPGRLVPDGHGSYKPEPYDGIQKIPNNAQFEYKGQYFPMNPTVTDAYGNGRIRLNQTDADLNVVPFGQQSAGYYLHGKGAAIDYTHGCVCDKSEEVFNYFWSGEGKDVRGYIPFVVE